MTMPWDENINAKRIREQMKQIDLRDALRMVYNPVEHDQRFDLLLKRLEEKERDLQAHESL